VGSYDNPQLGKWPTIRVTITRSENMSFQLNRLTETLAGIRLKKNEKCNFEDADRGMSPPREESSQNWVVVGQPDEAHVPKAEGSPCWRGLACCWR